MVFDLPLADAFAYATVMHGIAFVTYLVAGGPGLIRLLLARRLSAVESDELTWPVHILTNINRPKKQHAFSPERAYNGV